MTKQLSSTSQKTDFATWLNRYLEETDADLTSLAASAGISQGYLSMLRHGKRIRPSRQVVEALATAFGIPIEEALKAAGLSVPVRTRGSIQSAVRTRGRSRALASEESALGWSCRIETGKVALQADVQQLAEDTFQVRLKMTPLAQGVENMKGCHVHWLMDGLEQAAINAPAEGITFTLRSGKHEFRCQWEEGEELMLRVPVGISRVAEPLSTKQDSK